MNEVESQIELWTETEVLIHGRISSLLISVVTLKRSQ